MRAPDGRSAYVGSPPLKIRTSPGPVSRFPLRLRLIPLVNGLPTMYHQQTKSLLVSYSPKKLGFF